MILRSSRMFDCGKGFPIEYLLIKTLFELDGHLYENQLFLVNIMLRHLFQYRISQKQRGGPLSHVISFDEGKMVYDKSRDFIPGLGINEVTQITTQIREFGEGILVSDQMPTMISESIKSTCTLHMHEPKRRRNYQEMARAMNLYQEQTAYMTQLISDEQPTSSKPSSK